MARTAASTRRWVAGRTGCGLRLTTRETVATETPARAATSRMVALMENDYRVRRTAAGFLRRRAYAGAARASALARARPCVCGSVTWVTPTPRCAAARAAPPRRTAVGGAWGA